METDIYELQPRPRVVHASDNDDIYLSIVIGNGQIGGNIVLKGDHSIAKGNLTEPAFIGKSDELEDIDVYSNVLDSNNATDKAVITTTFVNQDNEVLFTKIDKSDIQEGGILSFWGKYSIKVMVLLLAAFLFNCQNMLAQGNSEFHELETPTSPGFILLDQTPSSIESPTTPQGLGLSLLGFQQNGGALEFSPFWITNHPNFTAEKLYQNKFPIVQNFAVSVAAIRTDTTSFLAGGFRSKIFQTYGSTLTTELNNKKIEIENELSKPPKLIDLARVKRLYQEYVDLTETPIFTIDLAGAIAAGSITNSFDDLETARKAVWLSFNYRPKAKETYGTLLLRYMEANAGMDQTETIDNVDIGLRINREIKEFALSIEYLQRLNIANEEYDNFRLALVGSYEINDQIYLTTTLGKNFSDVDNIIALAGVNFGISNNKVKAY